MIYTNHRAIKAIKVPKGTAADDRLAHITRFRRKNIEKQILITRNIDINNNYIKMSQLKQNQDEYIF